MLEISYSWKSLNFTSFQKFLKHMHPWDQTKGVQLVYINFDCFLCPWPISGKCWVTCHKHPGDWTSGCTASLRFVGNFRFGNWSSLDQILDPHMWIQEFIVQSDSYMSRIPPSLMESKQNWFLRRGGFRIFRRGEHQHKILPKFPKELHEIEKVLGHRGRTPRPPPQQVRQWYLGAIAKRKSEGKCVENNHFLPRFIKWVIWLQKAMWHFFCRPWSHDQEKKCSRFYVSCTLFDPLLVDFSSGSSGRVRGGLRNMKSMWPPLAAIFFMTYFHRARGGPWPPRPPRIRYWISCALSVNTSQKIGSLCFWTALSKLVGFFVADAETSFCR